MEDGTEVNVVAADAASAMYLERWHLLVSTTNWEKGRIIHEWREDLKASGAQPVQFSDEAWSRRIESVSGQHVGRLRRVHERFAAVRDSFAPLSWSHFCAALEWDDAELWLEGAVQSEWSVSHMRRQRWEAFGAVEDDRPREQDVVAADVDEDFAAGELGVPFDSGKLGQVVGVDPAPASPQNFADTLNNEDERDAEERAAAAEWTGDSAEGDETAPVRPFERLGELPPDMQQALEAFKLSILQHKLAGWHEVSAEQVVTALDALKQLALMPADRA